MKSPLMEILPLLKVYGHIGIFPAHVSEDGSVVTINSWRYLPLVIVLLAYVILVCSMFQWSTSEECLAHNYTWERYWKKLSNMGKQVVGCFTFNSMYVGTYFNTFIYLYRHCHHLCHHNSYQHVLFGCHCLSPPDS